MQYKLMTVLAFVSRWFTSPKNDPLVEHHTLCRQHFANRFLDACCSFDNSENYTKYEDIIDLSCTFFWNLVFEKKIDACEALSMYQLFEQCRTTDESYVIIDTLLCCIKKRGLNVIAFRSPYDEDMHLRGIHIQLPLFTL